MQNLSDPAPAPTHLPSGISDQTRSPRTAFFSPGLYKSRQTSFARPCTRIRTPSASCVTPSGYRILFLFRYSAILKSPVFPDIFYLLISATVTCGPEFPIINISKNIFLNNCRSDLFLLPVSHNRSTTITSPLTVIILPVLLRFDLLRQIV